MATLSAPSSTLAGEFETIPADLVLKSIGFKSVGIPGVAFDGRKGVILNKSGQVGGCLRQLLRQLGAAGGQRAVGGWRARPLPQA